LVTAKPETSTINLDNADLIPAKIGPMYASEALLPTTSPLGITAIPETSTINLDNADLIPGKTGPMFASEALLPAISPPVVTAKPETSTTNLDNADLIPAHPHVDRNLSRAVVGYQTQWMCHRHHLII
jgi:hypothetical protein